MSSHYLDFFHFYCFCTIPAYYQLSLEDLQNGYTRPYF